LSRYRFLVDGFSAEANAFVAQYDRLDLEHRASFADFPKPEQIRPLLVQAQFLWLQTNNPFMSLSPLQKTVVDFGRAFLQWASDPGNPARWERLFELRADLDDVNSE
jgi:hypothetical protein